MERSDLELLRRLLTAERVLTLALVEGGEPVAGLSPFLAAADLAALYVHGSRLSKHTRALSAGARFSAVIHAADRPEADPLRLPRLLLEGVVADVDEAERAALVPRWVERFPSAAMTVALGDFAFHRLDLAGGRLVAGFGRAFGLGPHLFAEAAALGEADGTG